MLSQRIKNAPSNGFGFGNIFIVIVIGVCIKFFIIALHLVFQRDPTFDDLVDHFADIFVDADRAARAGSHRLRTISLASRRKRISSSGRSCAPRRGGGFPFLSLLFGGVFPASASFLLPPSISFGVSSSRR